jgi:hypothetical protein
MLAAQLESYVDDGADRRDGVVTYFSDRIETCGGYLEN